jgi:antirestriction protein ArdC
MSRPNETSRPDLYQRVTYAIIADLAKGLRPWARPWSTYHSAAALRRPQRHNGEPYRGINTVLLWVRAAEQGYRSPTWLTFRQAVTFGGRVRAGEQGATVVYADRYLRREDREGGVETERFIPFLKAYTVFNVEQIDGLPERFVVAEPPDDPGQIIPYAEAFFSNLDARVRHMGNDAFYSPTSDLVQLPRRSAFADLIGYYSVLAHECVHWTGHPSRLGRAFDPRGFGGEGCAREELVAEIGAAFLCADLGLSLVPREDHAIYIDGWLKVLGREKRFIFAAAADAQKACDFLHALQPRPG